MCKLVTRHFQYYFVLLKLFIMHQDAYAKYLDIDIDYIFTNRILPLEIFNVSNHIISNDHLIRIPSNEFGLLQQQADIDNALSSMKYHRRMINEFMLANYITQQILTTDDNFPINKRMGGVAKTETDAPIAGVKINDTLSISKESKSNHLLLNNDGMERYKTWLRNIAILEDIRKHQAVSQQTQKTQQRYHTKSPQHHNRRQMEVYNTQDDRMGYNGRDEEEEEEMDEGDITGYALTNAHPYEYNKRQLSFLKLPHPLSHTQWSLTKGVSSEPILSEPANENEHERGYETTYDTVFNAVTPHTPESHSHSTIMSSVKEIGLKDITDIALTTLAFLSFGMFILQVLMCITMGKEDANNMMMLPMETTDELVQEGVEEIRRRRRSVLSTNELNADRLKMFNEVARRALFSIDVSISRQELGEPCVYRSLCESNRLARNDLNNQQYWMPVWSLGISWINARARKAAEKDVSNDGDYYSILNSLKAIVIGLNNGNCSNYYLSECPKY